MKNTVTLNLGDRPVQFTPDGKVFLIDAIKAVTNSDYPAAILKGLQKNYPELAASCNQYAFSEEETVPVTDSEGWEKIMYKLQSYLSSGSYQEN